MANITDKRSHCALCGQLLGIGYIENGKEFKGKLYCSYHHFEVTNGKRQIPVDKDDEDSNKSAVKSKDDILLDNAVTNNNSAQGSSNPMQGNNSTQDYHNTTYVDYSCKLNQVSIILKGNVGR